ncbi:unnamed protein product [Closterium sp. Yama58-4]|nr:unnamed protein product [Closterium sp. Yama58-4]
MHVGEMRRHCLWDDMGGRGGRVEQVWRVRGINSQSWPVHEAALIVASTRWRVATWRAMCHVAEKRGFVYRDEGKGKRRKEGKGNKREKGKGKRGEEGKGKNGNEGKGKREGEGKGRRGDAEKGNEADERKGGDGQEQAGGAGDGRKGSAGVVGAEAEGADGTRLHSRRRRRGRPRKVVFERGAAVPSAGGGNEADGQGGGSDGSVVWSDGGVREQQQEEAGGAVEWEKLHDGISSVPSHDDNAALHTFSSTHTPIPSPVPTPASSPPPSLHVQFQDFYSTHLADIAPPFASQRATRDNAMALLALHPPPHTLAAIFRACSSLFLVPLTHRIRAALEIFSAHGLPESLFLSVIRRVPELILDARLDDVSSNGSNSSSQTSSNKSSDTHEKEQTSNSHSEHQQQQDAHAPLSDSHNSPTSLPPSHLPSTDLPHLQQVLHFLFLHLPPPTVAKLLHSAACRVFRTPLPSLLLHLSAMHSMLAPPHSLLFRYPLALRFSPEILKERLSRLAEIVPLTEAQEGVGGENGSGGGDGEGRARRKIRLDSVSLLPIPPLDPSLSFSADPAVLSLVQRQPHILHASKVTMQEVVTTLTTLFGPQGTSYVLSRHPALLTVSPRTIEEAMFGLIDIFGEEVTLDMIQREPGIIQVRHSTLRPKIEFVLGEMTRSKDDIRVWPNVLLRSLPRMLVPRYFLVTRKDRHAARVLSLPCLFSSSDARFRRRWEVSDADWRKALMVGEVWEARRKEQGRVASANQ